MFSSQDSLFNDMQNLANSLKNDIERQLNITFNEFQVLEHEAINDPNNSAYYMKLKTDDNGHVKIKTCQREPGGEWKTDIQEYDRGNTLQGSQSKAIGSQSTQGFNQPLSGKVSENKELSQGQNQQLGSNISGSQGFQNQGLSSNLSGFGSNLLFDSGFQSWQNLADRIKNEVESQLNTNFNNFEVLEHEARQDPENTSFFMKVKTDDNGHVRVKTTRHAAGGEWKTDVQEYDRGQKLEGRSDRNLPLGSQSKQSYGISPNP